MEPDNYLSLLRFAQEGDLDAATKLLEEAQRRGDHANVALANELLGRPSVARSYVLRPPPGRAELRLETELNPAQLAVVRAGSGPLLVIAGAGSGKTRTLTYRVAYLLSRGVAPDRILLLTFTRRAAREMLDRVASVVGPDALHVWGGTFHHIALRVLRPFAPLLGFPETIDVLGREEAGDLMADCLGASNRTNDKLLAKERVLELLSLGINTSRDFTELVHALQPNWVDRLEVLHAALRLFGERKQRMGLLDYDDLLVCWRRLFLEQPQAADTLRARFEHVLVDEYQDTNALQGELVDHCAGLHKNLMVVGDESQSIYSFRGACVDNILSFERRYPDARRFLLEDNYRSTPEILALANLAITFNQRRFDKTLRAYRAPGVKPVLVPARDNGQQAQFIAQRIAELAERGTPLRHIAVLYRAHYQSFELQNELTRAAIPFELRSGERFFEQAHIKDVLAHLKFVFNPHDELSFLRVAKLYPDIFVRRASALWAAISDSPNPHVALRDPAMMSLLPTPARPSLGRMIALFDRIEAVQQHPADAIDAVLRSEYAETVQKRFDNAEHRLSEIEQLMRYAEGYQNLETLLGELALLTDVTGEEGEGETRERDRVVLSTVHQAKGLEWSVVFLCALFDGGFPTRAGQATAEGLEEERRAFYVALTRAKDELVLSYPVSMIDRGGWLRVQRPSQFLGELASQPGLYDTWSLSEV